MATGPLSTALKLGVEYPGAIDHVLNRRDRLARGAFGSRCVNRWMAGGAATGPHFAFSIVS